MVSEKGIILKTCSSFLNYFNSTSSPFPRKYLLVKEEDFFFVDEKCPNISVRLCLRTRGKLMLANKGILRLRPRKPIDNLIFFWRIKDFWRDQFTSRFLFTLRLSMAKNRKNSIFQLLPRNQDFARFFLTVAPIKLT